MSRVTDDIFRDRYWRTPAVRHLAWLLTTPSLLVDDTRAVPAMKHTDIAEKLQDIDRKPDALLSCIRERQSRRLGVYFEQLYRFALEHFMGCEVILQNQQVQDNQHTLGELDFIVRRHQDQGVEHHEIAVKFYLGYVPKIKAPDWWGPDSRDCLSRKLNRLLTHQAHLTEHATTRALLRQHGIERVQARICLRGYLFHPFDDLPTPDLPFGINAQSPQGYWLRLEVARQRPRPGNCLRVPIHKPDWLGPLQLPADTATSTTPDEISALQRIEDRGHPQLFADLEQTETGFWLERERFFVVPDTWPAVDVTRRQGESSFR